MRKQIVKKQRVRIYVKGNDVYLFDISNGLSAFYTGPVSMQFYWCFSLGLGTRIVERISRYGLIQRVKDYPAAKQQNRKPYSERDKVYSDSFKS